MEFQDIYDVLQKDIIVGIISIILILLGTILSYIKRSLLLMASKKIIEGVKNTFSKKCRHRIKGPDPFNILSDKSINDYLTELRVKCEASRVSLFQFHNGETFSTNEPIWKISTTHESCASGISSGINDIQDKKASMFTTILITLFTKNASEGIEKTIEKCPKTGGECVGKRGVYAITPKLLSSDFIGGLLINRGTVSALMSPVIDDRENIIGFLLIEYSNEHNNFKTFEENIKIPMSVCEMSMQIGSFLDLQPKKYL